MGQVCSCFAGLRHRRPCNGHQEDPLLEKTTVEPSAAPTEGEKSMNLGSGVAAHGTANGAMSDTFDKVTNCNSRGDSDLGGNLATSRKVQPPELETQSDGSSSEEDGELETPSGLMFPVAELGPDGLPSRGSGDHDKGECKRCCFFPKGRCQNGYNCRFCHFNHEKRKRMKKKKKRGTGSELPTPSSNTGSIMSLITPSGSLAGNMGLPLIMATTPVMSTPLGHALPLTPISPSAPPTGPPLLAGFSEAEPPPPPVEEPIVPPPVTKVAGAPAEQAAQTLIAGAPGENPAAAENTDTGEKALGSAVPTAVAQVTLSRSSPPPTLDINVEDEGGRAVTLTELLGVQEAPTCGTEESNVSATAPNLEGKQLPVFTPSTRIQSTTPLPSPIAGPAVWPTSYWSPFGVAPPGLGTNVLRAGEEHSASHTSIPPLLGMAGFAGPLTPSATGGLEEDSPRSALLTLCGAWGALAAHKAGPREMEGASAPSSVSRSEFLRFRRVTTGEQRPDVLKSLQVKNSK